MSKFGDQVHHDHNNNAGVDEDGSTKANTALFIERHLELGDEDDFLIVPNGGTGDCMFKAVSQAVFDGDESRHREIRKKVVDFIISQRWQKFSEFIKVQHMSGNNDLQRQWAKDPKQTYRIYMNLSGTLGSSSELTAASELYQYNFATVQEYCNSDKRTYRVENCILFDREQSDFHYFYFTGDYDNGHWEYIRNLADVKPDDGTYSGRHTILIEGEDISIESWLLRETENTNAPDQLKILTNRPLYMSRRSMYPFELTNCFRFQKNGTVKVNGTPYIIEDLEYTDLFSVLARECLQNEEAAHEIELLLIKHRYSYFEDVNNKLITQPWSHNFTTEAIKYCSYPCKGNIQDLVCAADLYSFSFVLFIKLEDTYEEIGEEVHQCKFTHVDRWGGENDRILHFFMRLAPAGVEEGLIAKWWLITPHVEKPPVAQKRRSKQIAMETTDTNTSRSSVMVGSVQVYEVGRTDPIYSHVSRPTTATCSDSISRTATPRPVTMTNTMSSHFSEQPSYLEDTYTEGTESVIQEDESIGVPPTAEIVNLFGLTSDDGDVTESKSSLTKDFENIFGKNTSYTKQIASSEHQAVRLEKRKIRTDKMKPATGRDLAEHPERVRTVVRVKDKNNANKEIIYRGKGYMKTDDVLGQLTSQGLIRLPSLTASRNVPMVQKTKEFTFDDIFAVGEAHQIKEARNERDENHNLTRREKSASGVSEESHDLFDAVFADDPPETVLPQKNPSMKKLFSETLISYMSKDNLKLKRNKVSPKSSDTTQEVSGDRHAHGDGMNKANTSHHRPCLSGLVKLIARLSASIIKMSRAIKKGCCRRKQYHRSASKISFLNRTGKGSNHRQNRGMN